MRRPVLLAVCLLVLAQCAALAATEPVQTAADPRLSQKVTYQGGYKRLHSAIEELSKQTGVAIYTGKTQDDWRVRDIPIVVCVKDMSLGRALNAIADATHVRFTSRKIEDQEKPTWTYRFSRGEKEEAEIDSVRDVRRQAQLAQAIWQWDAIAAYGKTQPVPDGNEDKWLASRSKEQCIISRLVASLDPGARDKLLNGDTFRFRGSDPVAGQSISDLYNLESEFSDAATNPGAPVTAPAREDVEDAELLIKLVDDAVTGHASLDMSFGPIRHGDSASTFSISGEYITNMPRENLDQLNVPPCPRLPTVSLTDDAKNLNMSLLSEEADWDQPLLKAEIDVVKPKDVKEPAFADFVRSLSAASGVSIVVEDFASHEDPKYQRVDCLFKKQTSVAGALRGLYIDDDGVVCNWLFSEKDKLLVGWVGGKQLAIIQPLENWRDHHRNMLSEAYLSGLRKKLDGPGVGLDDVVRVAILPGDSFYHWIDRSREFHCLSDARCREPALWRLYDSLRPSDKLLAQSREGIPLGKLDTDSIAGFFHAYKIQEAPVVPCMFPTPSEAERQKMQEESNRRARALSDPQIIATMVMRIEKTPVRSRPLMTTGGGRAGWIDAALPGLAGFRFAMSIDYKLDGKDYTMTVRGPSVMTPVYSPGREDEIIKAATPKSKAGEEKPGQGGNGKEK